MKKIKRFASSMMAVILAGTLTVGSLSVAAFGAEDVGSVESTSVETSFEEATEEVETGVSDSAVSDTSEIAAEEAAVTSYTVTLDANGGYFANEMDDILNETLEKTEILNKIVPVGGIVSTVPLYEQEGITATFLGWSLERNGEILPQEQEGYVPVGDCVLYAIWKYEDLADTADVPVTTVEDVPEEVLNNSIETEEHEASTPKEEVNKENDSEDVLIDETIAEENADEEAATYAVTLDANGGYFVNEWDDVLGEYVEHAEVVNKLIPVGGTVAASPMYEEEGVTGTFLGWSLERNGELVTTWDEKYTPLENNCILFALWEIEENNADKSRVLEEIENAETHSDKELTTETNIPTELGMEDSGINENGAIEEIDQHHKASDMEETTGRKTGEVSNVQKEEKSSNTDDNIKREDASLHGDKKENEESDKDDTYHLVENNLSETVALEKTFAANASYESSRIIGFWDNHKYMIFEEKLSPLEAQEFCQSLGGHVVSITSSSEQEFLERIVTLGDSTCYTIGGTDVENEGIWTWMNGEKWNYSNWYPGGSAGASEPNDGLGQGEDYSYMVKSREWKWVDYHGGYDNYTATAPFICEWDNVNNSLEGHIYKRFDESVTWTEAKLRCETHSGHLMTITSDEEQEIATTLCSTGNYNCWIGGTDEESEGIWRWVTGEQWSYTNWESGQPDNSQSGTRAIENYLQISTDYEYTWNDACNTQDRAGNVVYLCEWDNENAIEAPILDYLEVGIGGNVTVHWKNKGNSASGYKVRHRIVGTTDWKTTIVSNSSKTSVILENLSANDYEIDICSFKIVDGNETESSYSPQVKCPVPDIKIVHPVTGSEFADSMGLIGVIDFGITIKSTDEPGDISIHDLENKNVYKIPSNEIITGAPNRESLSIRTFSKKTICNNAVINPNKNWFHPGRLYSVTISEKSLEFLNQDDESYEIPVYFAGITLGEHIWEFKTTDISYSCCFNHGSDMVGVENFAKIPCKYYKKIFAPEDYNDIMQLDDGTAGYCFGFSYLTGAYNNNFSYLSKLTKGYDQLSDVPINDKILEYIRLAQIYQYTDSYSNERKKNNNKWKEIINAVSSKEDIIIGIQKDKTDKKDDSDKNLSWHAVYPLGIYSNNDQSTDIAVYDCNGYGHYYDKDFNPSLVGIISCKKGILGSVKQHTYGSFNSDITYFKINDDIDKVINAILENNYNYSYDKYMITSNTKLPESNSLTSISSQKGVGSNSERYLYWSDSPNYSYKATDQGVEITISDGTNKIYTTLSEGQNVNLNIETQTVLIDGVESQNNADSYQVIFSTAEDYDTFHEIVFTSKPNQNATTIKRTDSGVDVITDSDSPYTVINKELLKDDNGETLYLIERDGDCNVDFDKENGIVLINALENANINILTPSPIENEEDICIKLTIPSNQSLIINKSENEVTLRSSMELDCRTSVLLSDGTETNIWNVTLLEDTEIYVNYQYGNVAHFHHYITQKEDGATCIKNGKRFLICDWCGSRKTEDIPASGHTWNTEYTIDVEATTENQGSKSIHCSICGEIKDGSVISIPKKNPEKIIDAGNCGDDTHYILQENGNMLFYGNGAILDYSEHSSVRPWYNNASKIKNVVFGNGITHIGTFLFGKPGDGYSIESIHINGSVKTIGQGAFNFLSNLTSVSISEGVEEIGDFTFYDCTNLSSVVLPDSLVKIGKASFYNTVLLKNITIPGNVTHMGESPFEKSGLETVIIKSGCTKIWYKAFSYCTFAKTIIIPDTVTEIGEAAFFSCKNLIEFEIPDGVTTIGRYAFEDCDSLKTIHIPSSVHYIGTEAFGSCKNLGTVKFNGNAPIFEESTLSEKPGITAFYVDRVKVGYPYNGEGWNEAKELSWNVKLIEWEETGRISLEDASVLNIPALVYDGSAKTFSPKVRKDYKILTKDIDYVVSFSNNKNVGNGIITITGIGGYKGEVRKSFSILPASLEDISVEGIIDKTFIGRNIEQDLIVKAGDLELIRDIDYTVEYSNNINVGMANLTIVGKGNYIGSVIKRFRVIEAPLKDAVIIDIEDRIFSGEEQIQNPVVRIGNETLIEGIDYTLLFANNINAGTAKITITGKGNYAGTICKNFTIKSATIENATVTGISNKIYNNSSQTQVLTVKVGSKTLEDGIDYILSYKGNIKAGTAVVIITGKGNYTGTIRKNFTIKNATIENATVTGISNKTYNSSSQKQILTVKVGSETLEDGIDYMLSYKNNIKAGTAIVTITGKGNYAGTKTVTFKINKAPLIKAAVTLPAVKVWTGWALTPVPTVKVGTVVLKKGTDFSLVFTNNKNVGTATITITGKGNYTGRIKKYFKINPKPTSISKLTGGPKKITIGWKKQASQTSGYQIQYSSRKDFKTQKTVTVSGASKTSRTVSGLAKKHKYYVRIRTFKSVGKTKYYSTWNATKTVTTK